MRSIVAKYYVTKYAYGWTWEFPEDTGCPVLDKLSTGDVLSEEEFKTLLEEVQKNPAGWEWDEKKLNFRKIEYPDLPPIGEDEAFYAYVVQLTKVWRTKEEAIKDLTDWLWERKDKKFKISLRHSFVLSRSVKRLKGCREEDAHDFIHSIFTDFVVLDQFNWTWEAECRMKPFTYSSLYETISDSLSHLLSIFHEYESCRWDEWIENTGWFLRLDEQDAVFYRQIFASDEYLYDSDISIFAL